MLSCPEHPSNPCTLLCAPRSHWVIRDASVYAPNQERLLPSTRPQSGWSLGASNGGLFSFGLAHMTFILTAVCLVHFLDWKP
jgi:hypothetical protein